MATITGMVSKSWFRRNTARQWRSLMSAEITVTPEWHSDEPKAPDKIVVLFVNDDHDDLNKLRLELTAEAAEQLSRQLSSAARREM